MKILFHQTNKRKNKAAGWIPSNISRTAQVLSQPGKAAGTANTKASKTKAIL